MNQPHKKLEVWKESVDLASDIYKITESFPKHEVYGLSSQMRRAAVSIPSNIAEGAARSSHREFAQFLSISKGSLSELDTQIEIAGRLGYLALERKQEVEAKMVTISRMLTGLTKAVKGEVQSY